MSSRKNVAKSAKSPVKKTPAKAPALPIWRNRIVGYNGEVDPTTLLANPANWRIHPKEQQAALKGSLDKIGWIQNCVVNRATGFVLDGHARVALAIASHAMVPCLYVDLTPEEEALAIATLDAITGQAGTDQTNLDALVAGVLSSDIGKDLGQGLDDLLKSLSSPAPAGPTDAAAVGGPPAAPVTVLGDLWLLDGHRILCGDSASPVAVERLMAGEIHYEASAGAGSQIIAKMKTGVRCFAVALDPKSVDALVTRWQNFTGQKATLEDGTTFEQAAGRPA